MEIWYLSSAEDTPVPFSSLGIGEPCLKHISLDDHDGSFTMKRHFHTNYELHLVVRGEQRYETEAGEISVGEGEAVLFAPHGKHRQKETEFPLEKYAFTFSLSEQSISAPTVLSQPKAVPYSLISFIEEIGAERGAHRESSRYIVGGRVLESLVRLLRIFGAAERQEISESEGDDGRIVIAHQYIKDNATLGITTGDVARYCHVSERQLQRLFAATGDGVAACIRRARVRAAEQLLAKTELSLAEIAERTSLGDEFYFNACFKRENGMTPGAYRKAFKS